MRSTPTSDGTVDRTPGEISEGTPADCVVLVPTYAHIETACEAGLRVLEDRGYVVRRAFGASAIDSARNIMATRALNDGFQQLMWIDSDMGFEPDFVDQLRRHRLPYVSGAAVKKGIRGLAFEPLPETAQIDFGQFGGLLRVRFAGAGFLLTHRRVYETIQQHFDLPTCNTAPERQPASVPWFQPMVIRDGAEHIYLSEDYAFCERARQCGFEIVVDTTRRLHHIGAYGYSWEDAGGSTHRYDGYRYEITQP